MSITIALIDTLDITEEERQLTKQKVCNLVQIHRRGTINGAIVNRLFGEWMEIAKRIKKGEEMLNEATAQSTQATEQHSNQLYDLFVLQLHLVGLYEVFFRTHLTQGDRFERAYEKIFAVMK